MKKLLVYDVGHAKDGKSEVIFNLLKCEYFKDFEITLILLDNLETNYMFEIQKRRYKVIMLRSISNNLVGHYIDIKNIFKNKYDFFWYNIGELVDYKIIKEAKKSGAKVITHIHGLFAKNDYYNYFKRTLIKLFKSHINKKYYEYSDIFIGCVDEIEKKLINSSKGKNIKFFLLRNAIDVEKFKFNEELRKITREELNIGGKDILLGSVGELCNIKNYIFLLEVLMGLPLIYKLVLVGDGEEKKLIKKAIKDFKLSQRVQLLGKKENIRDYLTAMDIYCLPSLHEGLSLAAIEAQASNLPIVLGDNLSRTHIANKRARIALFNDVKSWQKEICSIDVKHNRKLYDDSWVNEYDLSAMQKKFCKILDEMI